MALKTITNLLQRFIPPTRMPDMADITTTYRKGLDRPSDTRRVMGNPHRVVEKVRSRRKGTIIEVPTSETLTVMEENSKTDSGSAKAETLRRHARHRAPTDRAKGLMKNGSWDVQLRTASSRRKKTKKRPPKPVRSLSGRTSGHVGRMANIITTESISVSEYKK